jgi:predicted aconitase
MNVVKLTDSQQRLLEGQQGAMTQRLMRLLVRLGEIYGADRMVEISSAQVSGVSYKSIGEPGLEFIEDIANAGVKVRVLTFLNPAGMDLRDWRALGFPEDFALPQERIIAAFSQMGAATAATCTPYLAGNLPCLGEHLAWSESSAVSFANSVLGARTNREGGPSALAAAVCGCTPRCGLHLTENRHPTIAVEVEAPLESAADFGALGYYVGEQVKDGIPYFTGISAAGVDDLKALGAAMAASGAIALYHVDGLTPEANTFKNAGLGSFKVGPKEIKKVYERLNTGDQADLLVFGCPHASLKQVRDVANRLQGKTLRKPLWVCTSRMVKEMATEMGWTKTIEQAGGRVIADTCMVVAPIERMGFKTIAVDSGKAANYLPGFCRQKVVFGSIDALLEEALS